MKNRIFTQDFLHRPHSSIDMRQPKRKPMARYKRRWRRNAHETALVLILAAVAAFVCYNWPPSEKRQQDVSYLPVQK